MLHWQIYLSGLIAISFFALLGWILSLARDNVTHVNSMWSLFIGMSAYTYALFFYNLHPRTLLVLVLVTLWALRLSMYLAWRDWSTHEDRRYASMRKKHQPYFWFTSIYIIFGLHAITAWIVSLPLFSAISTPTPLNFLDYIGALIIVFGLFWEGVADGQLATFKSKPENQHKVLCDGLWQYCRHPNYFGECCVWWGFYLIALAAGAWWSITSPILVTFLLIKVRGIAVLEKDICNKHPDYAHYIKTTNSFLPKRRKVN
jgi:steroid 5-alpha reductase family enzyme